MKKTVVGPLQKSAARGLSKPEVCTYADCRGVVEFGRSRSEHWCRRHESAYLLDEEYATDETINSLSSRIGVRDDGCWQFEQAWGDGVARPTLTSAGLKWQVVRFLYVYFFGGHKGGLELGHICHNEWCVHPGHVTPITGAKNRKDRDVLNADPDTLSRADRRRLEELGTEAMIIALNPVTPSDESSAYVLREFTSRLGRALPEVIATTIPAPATANVAPVKEPVSLFRADRPQVARPRRPRVAVPTA